MAIIQCMVPWWRTLRLMSLDSWARGDCFILFCWNVPVKCTSALFWNNAVVMIADLVSRHVVDLEWWAELVQWTAGRRLDCISAQFARWNACNLHCKQACTATIAAFLHCRLQLSQTVSVTNFAVQFLLLHYCTVLYWSVYKMRHNTSLWQAAKCTAATLMVLVLRQW